MLSSGSDGSIDLVFRVSCVVFGVEFELINLLHL